jgi:hypothetical protein
MIHIVQILNNKRGRYGRLERENTKEEVEEAGSRRPGETKGR